MSSAIKLVRKNATDFEEFGLFAFETRARLEGSHGGVVATVTTLFLARLPCIRRFFDV